MLSFENTEIAFKSKSTPDLKKAYWLFKIVSSPIIVKIGKVATNFALSLRLPIRKIVKATIFKQFCGGTTIDDCEKTTNELYKFGIGTILDYSVEGKTSNEDFEKGNVYKTINLPNIGREAHTYLYHIINNYDNLADINVFLPGSVDTTHKMFKNNVRY